MFTDYVVDRIIVESVTIKSFYLKPQNGLSVPTFTPGQFINMKLRFPGEEKEHIRSYSLSDSPGKNYLRLTVKKEREGKVSNYLYDAIAVGDIIPLSEPAGNFILDNNSSTPVVFLSAGVGITPMLSMAEYLHDTQSDREVHFIHSSRSRDVQPMLSRLEEISASCKRFSLSILHSSPLDDELPGIHYHHKGRITGALIPTVDQRAYYYVCGPKDYIKDVRGFLRELGVPDNQIFFEYFSDGVREQSVQNEEKNEGKSFKIRLLRSDKHVLWDPGKGTLLELIESAGLEPANSCRMGTCSTCESRLVKGTFEYDPEPLMEPSDDNILICCAIPTSDMEIEL